LERVAEEANRERASIHMPRIGTGAGRGSWPLIETIIIEKLVSDGLAVTVYDLPTNRKAQSQGSLFT
ncbi:MAG: hypothetical protein ACLQJR_21625, partial [Stellaceae bacterium]